MSRLFCPGHHGEKGVLTRLRTVAGSIFKRREKERVFSIAELTEHSPAGVEPTPPQKLATGCEACDQLGILEHHVILTCAACGAGLKVTLKHVNPACICAKEQ